MSPTIYKTKNLRIVIYPHDHAPAHVHLIGPDAEAKFELASLECISSFGFSMKALSKIRTFLKARQHNLIETWNEWQEE